MENNFEKLLKERDTTTYRVSKDTGIPHTTLYEWSKGIYTPRAATIIKVAKHFDVPVEDLVLEGDDYGEHNA